MQYDSVKRAWFDYGFTLTNRLVYPDGRRLEPDGRKQNRRSRRNMIPDSVNAAQVKLASASLKSSSRRTLLRNCKVYSSTYAILQQFYGSRTYRSIRFTHYQARQRHNVRSPVVLNVHVSAFKFSCGS